jgi:hypothetical protein
MSRKLLPIALSGALLVAACSAPTQPYLDNARALCSTGDQVSCGQIPSLQAQVNAEHNDQAGKVALGVLAVLGAAAAGAAAGYAASHPAPSYTEVVVVCRPWWSC